jgi:hypothetical protein
MAFGDNSSPVRFGTGQTADARNLFLKVFGGEILTAFTATTITKGKVRERSISSGKEAQFIRTGTSTAEYLTAGQEMLGNPFATGEVTITADEILATHHDIYDLDTMLSHFDIRGPMTEEMGSTLARAYDQNNFRQIILAARTAAVGPFPAGNVITNAALAVATPDGSAWVNAIRQAKVALRKKNIPATAKLYAAVPPEIFDAIKYAVNAQGNYILLNRDMGATQGSFAEQAEVIRVEGVEIMPSNLLPNANETAVTTVYPKYRANFATTTGVMWMPDAVGALQLGNVEMESARDHRRKSDFVSATMVVGHGTLRCEGAVEFKTA